MNGLSKGMDCIGTNHFELAQHETVTTTTTTVGSAKRKSGDFEDVDIYTIRGPGLDNWHNQVRTLLPICWMTEIETNRFAAAAV
ncbi:hypothetical protein TYRP_010909 [Tyrophagus putrescentiae]|nr:hypothetical protein TYRP_010909 [Tyrophagus putrescentiae]